MPEAALARRVVKGRALGEYVFGGRVDAMRRLLRGRARPSVPYCARSVATALAPAARRAGM